MAHTQRFFSDLVHEKSDGEVEIRFLEGKSLPTFQMPGMVQKGEIEATNVPGFFFTRVPELGVQAIPYLFEGLEHSRRFPRKSCNRYLWNGVHHSMADNRQRISVQRVIR